MRYFLGILILMLTFTSCGTTRSFRNTSEFAPIHSIKDLEGHFLNRCITDVESGNIHPRSLGILSSFRIWERANFFTIVAKSPTEIKLIYYNDSGERQERVFEGRMRENFFEICLYRRRLILPPIITVISTHRVRIAKTADNRLIVKTFDENFGFFLLLSGGHTHEFVMRFPLATEYKSYIPIYENGLWGFADSYGNIVIPKRFDFVSIFVNGVAYVKLNDKWGLINEQGEEVIPIKYDRLEPLDRLYPPRFRATISERTGILDINGNEIVPVIYDDIDHFHNRSRVSIRLNDKIGFADRNGVIIPAIYSRMDWRFREHRHRSENKILLQRDGRLFLVDMYGYEYETRNTIFRGRNVAVPIPETRRKIQFDEQRIKVSD